MELINFIIKYAIVFIIILVIVSRPLYYVFKNLDWFKDLIKNTKETKRKKKVQEMGEPGSAKRIVWAMKKYKMPK